MYEIIRMSVRDLNYFGGMLHHIGGAGRDTGLRRARGIRAALAAKTRHITTK